MASKEQEKEEKKDREIKNTSDIQEVSFELKIPKERIAILIGKDGETKNKIEEASDVKIDINSEEGDVFITGKNALNVFNASEVVKATARGFNPEIALLLLKVDYVLEIINLKNIAKNKNHLQRIKGRIIGSEGKTRRIIEELTICNISVYGKTIGIIGRAENCTVAKQAIEMIIEGSPHSAVYKFLEKKQKSMRIASLNGNDISTEIKEKFQKFNKE